MIKFPFPLPAIFCVYCNDYWRTLQKNTGSYCLQFLCWVFLHPVCHAGAILNAFLRKCKKKYAAVVQNMTNQAWFKWWRHSGKKKSLQTKKQTKNNRKSSNNKNTHQPPFQGEIFYCSRREPNIPNIKSLQQFVNMFCKSHALSPEVEG